MTLSEERHVGFQVSASGDTCWVHIDAETPGRFSKMFGMDVHETVEAQMKGASQCLNCTHGAAGYKEWLQFCKLMLEIYEVEVPHDLLKFDEPEAAWA